jgi:hypothetical protein
MLLGILYRAESGDAQKDVKQAAPFLRLLTRTSSGRTLGAGTKSS